MRVLMLGWECPPYVSGGLGRHCYELTKKLVERGIELTFFMPKKGANVNVKGMKIVGIKFRENKIFVPEVLMAAKAMTAGMNHLRPYFQSGEVQRKGTFIIGTVMGDLHDIGKNLLGMIVEGAGWEVIDLGIDVPAAKFLAALEEQGIPVKIVKTRSVADMVDYYIAITRGLISGIIEK